MQLNDFHIAFAHLVDEVEVVTTGVLHPQHIVEQQVVAVGRSEALVSQAGRAHEHLAQLADLGVNAVARRTDSSLQFLSGGALLNFDCARSQGHHTRNGAEENHPEQHRLGGAEDTQPAFAPCFEVERRGGRVQDT